MGPDVDDRMTIEMAQDPIAIIGVVPDIVHIHWPEVLSRRLGEKMALAFLDRLTRAGSRVIQTIHNLWPHDESSSLVSFIHRIDAATAGVHFFSPQHDLLGRTARPNLPSAALHLPHPVYSDLPVVPAMRGRAQAVI